MSRSAVATLVLLVVALGGTGCAAASVDPDAIGERTQLCAGRLTSDQAVAAIGGPMTGLRELNDFAEGVRVGQCTLADDNGAVLDLMVVADPSGQELAGLLRSASSTPNYDSNEDSAVAGEADQTEAYAAVDDHAYARVLVNRPTSEERRLAALVLVRSLAEVSRPLP